MSIQKIVVQGNVPEKGTAIVTISPTDEKKVALTFAQLTNPQWQLMRTRGTVVNGRDFASSSLTSLQFVLTGDDLAIFGSSDKGDRRISFQASYNGKLDDDSTFVGKIVAEGEFNIFDVLGQTNAS